MGDGRHLAGPSGAACRARFIARGHAVFVIQSVLCVRACVRPRHDALAAASCAALTRPAPALSGISAACVTLHTACCIPIRGPERSIAYVSRPLRWNQPPMRLALQALERPKLEPFVPAKTAKQPFPITTYCTPSALGSQAGRPALSIRSTEYPCDPALSPSRDGRQRARDGRTAHCPPAHATSPRTRSRPHVRALCAAIGIAPKTPEVPNAVQCASCEFQYACFPTTSAVSRSRLIE